MSSNNINVEYMRVAAYCRLSREDGDKSESDSISNQRKLLSDYISKNDDLYLQNFYTDDGYTGTNFDRPSFKAMIADIEAGKIDCVIVKDLSRFGRDYIETGRYLERWLPKNGVRFIALNDHIDSSIGTYDMMLPIKNVFNAQYARDISEKVRSAMRTKQKQGSFVGAFASYGYLKSPNNHNELIIDPPAAEIVRRIYAMYENGIGKIKIAKILNEDKIPSPSIYKQLMGEKYQNGQRLDSTTYWTYTTIHRILQNRMYAGDMTQNHAPRTEMHGRATTLSQEEWIVVPNTHPAIISREQFDRVQVLMNIKTHSMGLNNNIHAFSGFLKCADCGRAMIKKTTNGKVSFTCGSYKRYGASVCSPHYITYDSLEEIVLRDLNKIISAVPNLQEIIREIAVKSSEEQKPDIERIELSLERIFRLKKGAYEDYREDLLSKNDYVQYKSDYERQENALKKQLLISQKNDEKISILDRPWIKNLLEQGRLTELDRVTIAETIQKIRVFDKEHIEIIYRFSEELDSILQS